MPESGVQICFPQGKRKVLTFSFDDGKIQDERLIEIFNTNGLKGTFNLNFGPMTRGAGNRVPPERVRELYCGHEVACHGLDHMSADRCPSVETAVQILENRKGLEQLTDGLVRGHAYPNGIYTAGSGALLKQLGIAYARVWDASHEFRLPNDYYEWHPTCHSSEPILMDLAQEFAAMSKHGYLSVMFVAGHSYEFDLNNSWHIIEEFSAFMGGREDIWYATNLEVADYMAAAARLCFSADCQRVYNPNDCSVWVVAGKVIRELPSGRFTDLAAPQ